MKDFKIEIQIEYTTRKNLLKILDMSEKCRIFAPRLQEIACLGR